MGAITVEPWNSSCSRPRGGAPEWAGGATCGMSAERRTAYTGSGVGMHAPALPAAAIATASATAARLPGLAIGAFIPTPIAPDVPWADHVIPRRCASQDRRQRRNSDIDVGG